MFERFPVAIDALRGSTDAARLVDAAVDWVKVAAAAEAQRFAIIAEFAALSLAESGEEDACLWWVDEEDDVIAEISAAFGVSTRWAMGDLEIGAAMRERFPGLAAVFLRGEISAKVMATVVDRTVLVTDAEALAAIDGACVEAAVVCGWSGLTMYKLKNAIDVWVHRHDPAAVRRARDKVRGRSFTVRDEADGTSLVFIRMGTPGAALVTGRLRKMAKGVCKDDPRTLDQRMVDAVEALAADANHLQCSCGCPRCPASADDGVASRYLVHIYAEAAVVDAEPDPLMHGEDPGEPLRPATVTIKYPEKKATATPGSESPPGEKASGADDPAGSAQQSEDAAAPQETTVSPAGEQAEVAASSETAETRTAEAPKPSRPRHCPAPAAPVVEGGPQSEVAVESEPEAVAPVEETAAADTASAATPPPPTAPSSTTVGPPAGVIPGFGIVPAALLAAKIAGGATVSHLKPPAVDAEGHYRISAALRDWVKARDLMCRFPGCDRPIEFCDLDHTVPYAEGGPTHASDLKGYCRHHHLIKTFRDGWSEIQKPDGTIVLTSPIGRTYTTIPTSRLLFPSVDTTSAPITPGTPKPRGPDTTATMPKRKRTKAQDRAYRIAAERALNDAYLAAHYEPPPY